MPTPSPLATALILAILASIVGAWIWVVLRLALSLPVLPPKTPRIVPWGGFSVLATLLLWIALTGSVPIAYMALIKTRPAAGADANAGGKGRFNLKPGELMTLSAIQNAATLVLIPLLLAATSGAKLRDLGVVATDLDKQVGRGILAYPLLAPVVFGAMGMAVLVWGRQNHPLEDAIVQDKAPGMVLILVLAGVVLAPAAEELIFRGVLLGWLTRVAMGRGNSPGEGDEIPEIDEFLPDEPGRDMMETLEIDSPEGYPGLETSDTSELATLNPYAPPVASISRVAIKPAPFVEEGSRAVPLLAANVAVSLLFAAMHGAVWPTPIPIFFLSLGLGFLYQRTGGILAPIALHMTFNGVSTAMMFLLLGAAPAPKPGPKEPEPIPAQVVVDVSKKFAIGPIDAPRGIWYGFLPQR